MLQETYLQNYSAVKILGSSKSSYRQSSLKNSAQVHLGQKLF